MPAGGSEMKDGVGVNIFEEDSFYSPGIAVKPNSNPDSCLSETEVTIIGGTSSPSSPNHRTLFAD